MTSIRICFVCSGNICRSPTAEVVMRRLVLDAGLSGRVEVCSAGIGAWHAGDGADPRSAATMRAHGYDPSGHRARQGTRQDLVDHELVIAMDRGHARDLERMLPLGSACEVRLLLSYDASSGVLDVPDPYYGGPSGFDDVLAMIERACRGLLAEVRRLLGGPTEDPAAGPDGGPRVGPAAGPAASTDR
ncbi:MAG: low molecular weight phosphotyrosine protein phosphatase [Frankiales bacterium]|nr:low molecular weight phosphotyrosine protein phosphatase [Frankiales bacterium]